jgi:hypothetical protein
MWRHLPSKLLPQLVEFRVQIIGLFYIGGMLLKFEETQDMWAKKTS